MFQNVKEKRQKVLPPLQIEPRPFHGEQRDEANTFCAVCASVPSLTSPLWLRLP